MSIYTTKQLASTLHLKTSLLHDLAKRKNSCYRPYQKRKNRKDRKDGTDDIPEKRTIDNPNQEIKSVQKIIDRKILKPMIDSLPPYMHGARSGKNISTSAEVHVGQPALLTLDLKDCFPSISSGMIYDLFRTHFGYNRPIATLLTQLTTYQGHLPQGSPTSSSLCNLILEPLVTELHILCTSRGINFSQFMDDFYLSGQLLNLLKTKQTAISCITNYRFKVNQRKARIITRAWPMELANTVINRKVSIGRSKKHALERAIIRLTKNDFLEYESKNHEVQAAQRQHRKIPKCKTKIHTLKGQIANVFAINQEQGLALQQKLTKKINSLF